MSTLIYFDRYPQYDTVPMNMVSSPPSDSPVATLGSVRNSPRSSAIPPVMMLTRNPLRWYSCCACSRFVLHV